jgi:hypothetical protein
MKTIIGLGQLGCDIAEMFEQVSGYRVKLLDTEIEGPNCYELGVYDGPEEYEANTPDLSQFFSDIDGEVLFVLAGHTNASGSTLQILKQLAKHKPNILYLVPDNEVLDNTQTLQLNLTFNVLQEYSRSDVIGRVFLVSNSRVEAMVGETSLLEAEEKFNKFVVDTVTNLDYFSTQQAVLDKAEQLKSHAKIASYGILDLSSGEDNFYYPMMGEMNRIYYFAINEEELKKDNKLIKKIKDFTNKEVRSSYKVFNIKTKQSYCYFVSYSSEIQKLDMLKDF